MVISLSGASRNLLYRFFVQTLSGKIVAKLYQSWGDRNAHQNLKGIGCKGKLMCSGFAEGHSAKTSKKPCFPNIEKHD